MSENSIVPLKLSGNRSIAKMAGISLAHMGSSVAGMMFIIATIQQFCPTIFHDFVQHLLARLASFFRPKIHITFYEFDAYSFATNEAYLAVEAYVGVLSMDATKEATRLKADKADKRSTLKSIVLSLEEFEEIDDEFEGTKFTWLLGKLSPNKKAITHSAWSEDKRFYRLTFGSKYRRLATAKYLRHVIDEGEAIIASRRTRMLFTNNPSHEWSDYKRGIWRKYVFEHPATFENLAIDPSKKAEIIEDLLAFTKAKDYYVRIGKAWKRGYMLYGPPGTGKTTMVACMANLLGYDVYDLELTTIKDNSELRNLLISTRGKSIILIEDIDCTLLVTAKRSNESDDKEDDDDEDDDSEDKSSKEKVVKKDGKKSSNDNKVTLSGLLNIIDGLWSPCSQERIIVFTTNHIEKLDPALIRTGRMDKHIEMSYCTFEAFKIFAKNYLNVESHPLFSRIEELLSEANIGPSDVAEILLLKRVNEDPEKRLKDLIEAIEKVKEAQKSAKPDKKR